MNIKSTKSQLEIPLPSQNAVSPLYIEPQAGLSPEMRRLENRWLNGQGWQKRLEYIELNGH